ncbi:MAG: ribosome maturation factor RimM [Clostridia bacterium]|nr:ribosome maturation factor RimM [Clostridia bacterium]
MQYLECGKVCAPHGVRGLFKTEVWCDSPKVLAKASRVFLAKGEGRYEEHAVTSATVAGNTVLLGIAGISSREEAQAIGGKTLYLDRSDIPVPRGGYFLADLPGLPVTDKNTGKLYGTVREVSDGVATRLLTVKTPSGDVILPLVPAFVAEVDTDRGVFVTPIPGFFDGDAEVIDNMPSEEPTV